MGAGTRIPVGVSVDIFIFVFVLFYGCGYLVEAQGGDGTNGANGGMIYSYHD